jgi:pre-rRNA-processing protein IPI1
MVAVVDMAGGEMTVGGEGEQKVRLLGYKPGFRCFKLLPSSTTTNPLHHQPPKANPKNTMGSSSKKKNQKAADFKKPKLRVGKRTQPPTNHTATSFRSKSIVLSAQSLASAAPSLAAQLHHHATLLSHHSPQTRRESLSFLSAHVPSLTPSTLLPRLAPLLLDPSNAVRNALLLLLQKLPPREMTLHMNLLLLHVWSAMSHIDPDIRNDSTRFLGWALGVGRAETLGGGGWGRGLAALAGVLGFAGERSVGGAAGRLRHLEVLREFLAVGVTADEKVGWDGGRRVVGGLHWSAEVQLAWAGVGAYRYLGLFDSEVEERRGGGEDTEGRRWWLFKNKQGMEVGRRLQVGLVGMTKEGGEVGRAAGRVLEVLRTAENWDGREDVVGVVG